jgi:Flp pilus assembly protein TadD
LAALLVVGLGIWAAIQVVRLLVSNDAPPTQSAQPTPTAIGQPSRPTPPPSGAAASTTRATDPAAPVNAPRAAGAPRMPRLPAQGLGSSPDSDANHFELALRYHNLGNYDEALKHYLAVLARDEFNVEARNNLGLLYHGRAMTREAIDQFRRAIAIHPQYVRARSNLAVVLTDAGRLAEARAELRAAMAMEPRNVDLLVNMALVEKADGHRDQAVELLVKAIGLQPTHGIAHYNAAVLYEERGSLALAYDHYEAFLKYGGPEHGLLLSSVQRRLVDLKPRLQTSR